MCFARALLAYLERTCTLHTSNQLLVCFGDRALGRALSKERLSYWIVETIALAYSAAWKVPLEGNRAHSTRGVATSWALLTVCQWRTCVLQPRGPHTTPL